MLRRTKRVKCPNCGHRFIAFDIEDNATAGSMPVHCPKCGTEIQMTGRGGLLGRLLGPDKVNGY